MTTARASVEQDRVKRLRRYLLAMGLRIVVFPLSVWMLLNDMVVVGILLAVLAIVTPTIAVVLANAVDRRGLSGTDDGPVSPVRSLGPTPGATSPSPADEHEDEQPDTPAPGPVQEIRGTVVSSHDTPYPDGRPQDHRKEAS